MIISENVVQINTADEKDGDNEQTIKNMPEQIVIKFQKRMLKLLICTSADTYKRKRKKLEKEIKPEI